MDDPLLAMATMMLWQISCVTGTLFFIALVVRQRLPHVMYALCLMALMKCIIPPVWTSSLGLFCGAHVIESHSAEAAAAGHRQKPPVDAGDAQLNHRLPESLSGVRNSRRLTAEQATAAPGILEQQAITADAESSHFDHADATV